jgi:CheY-like chemotaxis protein
MSRLKAEPATSSIPIVIITAQALEVEKKNIGAGGSRYFRRKIGSRLDVVGGICAEDCSLGALCPQ